jgi:hypothetical protein
MSTLLSATLLPGDGQTTDDGRAQTVKGFRYATAAALAVGTVMQYDTGQTGFQQALVVKAATVVATSGNQHVAGVLKAATVALDGTNLANIDVVVGKDSFVRALADASVTGAGIPLGVDTTAGTFTALAASFAALAAGEAGNVVAVSMEAAGAVTASMALVRLL